MLLQSAYNPPPQSPSRPPRVEQSAQRSAQAPSSPPARSNPMSITSLLSPSSATVVANPKANDTEHKPHRTESSHQTQSQVPNRSYYRHRDPTQESVSASAHAQPRPTSSRPIGDR